VSCHATGAAIILAAGASTRLGEPKQLVKLGGEERLLDRALRVAAEAGCEPVIVILGANAAQIRAECRLETAQVLENKDWREGMASSLRAGIAAVAQAERAIVMTCDQPAVTAGHLLELMRLCTTGPVASAYDGRRGVPACFPCRMFAQLRELSGDAGARVLLESAPTVDLPGGGIDIDTPESLAQARNRYGAG
jgi:CTP:molybdopterin cytidylyltransferase MocA